MIRLFHLVPGHLNRKDVILHLKVGDASRFCRTTIIDVKRQLILSRQETSFIRRMTYVLQMGAQYGEQRIIYDETGQVVDIIEPISAENVNIIEQPVIRTRDGSSVIRTTSAASMAASEPRPPIAIPTSARARTGASLIPSPTKANLLPGLFLLSKSSTFSTF